jgi:hypothetical protein
MKNTQSIFTDLENLILVVGMSRPINVRFIGKSKQNYWFEKLRNDGLQHKGGGQMIPLQKFHFGSDKIEGKRVVVME